MFIVFSTTNTGNTSGGYQDHLPSSTTPFIVFAFRRRTTVSGGTIFFPMVTSDTVHHLRFSAGELLFVFLLVQQSTPQWLYSIIPTISGNRFTSFD
uniref:Uncharacterized protein n=1 Tax=Nelumbo nucifera TaxID=4432 RepID=A0A822YHD0_NELNU|nr:TPA_asm: hypothetical protein HUJ06_010768 [Nelumbo nucifera]